MTNRSYLETAYKLRQNPFANLVDPNVEMAGRLKEKQKWTEIVDTRKNTNANTMCFILGDYGFGKTLTLNKIVEQYRDDPDVLPIFMKMLPEDKVTKFGVDFIQRIFRRIPQSIFESFNLNDLDALDKTYNEPAKVFRWIVLKDDRGLDFIRGQRSFSASEMNKLGVKRKIDKTDVAKEYLLSFLYLLKEINKKTLLIAVDETEYVFSQMSGANIAIVFNTLRDLYDLTTSPTMPRVPGLTANIIFFFAISSGGWGQFQDLGKREAAKPGPVQPLLRRIFDEQIELSPLSPGETKELIEKRLRENRISGDVEDKPLIPYDDSFVEYVYKLSNGGNPSEVLRFCDAALEEGLREKTKILNKDFAQKAFIAHGLLVEP